MTAGAPVGIDARSAFEPSSARTPIGSPSVAWTVLAACFGLLLLVPWQSESTRAQLSYLDFSWVWALSDGFVRGRVLGRDLIFTAGPLGFLGPRAYVPRTGLLLWLGWSVIAVVWSSLLWRQLARAGAKPVLRIVLFGWTVVCATLSSDAFFLAVPILAAAIVVARRDDNSLLLDVLAVAVLLAAGSLVKFSYLVAAAVTVVILSAWDISRRRWPAAGITYAAAMLFLWLACGQPLGAFPEFIGTSLQIAGGYTPAMSFTDGDRRALFAVVASMTIAVAVAVWVTVKRRSIAFGIVSVIWIATWLLVAKASFVRFDPIHEVIAPLWAATALPILWSATMMNDGSVGTNALMAVALLGSWGSTELALRHASRPALVSGVVGVPRRAFRSARSLANLRRARDREQANFDAMRRSEIARTPLPQIGGTVDAYPTDVSALLSHGFEYEPRPVLQSYAAYTPRLSALNAAHLRGSRAPENLLLDIAPIDARLASMEDGASWIEIWRRYSLAADTGGFLWLRRRANPLPIADPRSLSTTTATIGVPFTLPDVACGGLMASFDLQPTLWYRLRTLLWKAPEVSLRFTPGDRERRVAATMLGVPFLISPVIDTRREFAEFMQTGGTVADIGRPEHAELRILAREPERYFGSRVTVHFYLVQPVEACAGSSTKAPAN